MAKMIQMQITFRDLVWVGIVVLIVLYLSKCKRDETGIISDQVRIIRDKLNQDSVKAHFRITKLEFDLSQERGKTRMAITESKAVSGKLQASEVTVSRLIAAVRKARLLTPDTNFVAVAPGYVTFCDSLASSADSVFTDINRYKNLSAAILAGKARELSLKDSIIKTERTFSEECRAQFSSLQALYRKTNVAPRNQVFIGAEILGTQNTILQNVGAVISLKTKGNKLWQLSGGLQNGGGWYGRINGNILLSFK